MSKAYSLEIEQRGEEDERLISRGHHDKARFLDACHQFIATHPNRFPPEAAQQARFELIMDADGVEHQWLRAGPPHKPCGCEWDDTRWYSTVSGPGRGVFPTTSIRVWWGTSRPPT
jgi:hypothetical protein